MDTCTLAKEFNNLKVKWVLFKVLYIETMKLSSRIDLRVCFYADSSTINDYKKAEQSAHVGHTYKVQFFGIRGSTNA